MNQFVTAVFLTIISSVPLVADEVWHTSFREARDKARELKVPLILNFTGSDWCVWCQKLESELYSDTKFIEAANEKYVAVKLDFPRRKRLPLKLERQNNELQHKFAVRAYPTVIWLEAASGREIYRHNYLQTDAEMYILQLGKLADLNR